MISKTGIEETFLNLIKNIYKKRTENIIINGEIFKDIFFEIRSKVGTPNIITSIQHCIGGPS